MSPIIKLEPDEQDEERELELELDYQLVTGVTFEQVWHNRVRDKFGQTPTYFASLDDLIKMKEAAGRPKDLEDLKVLLKLKQRQEQGK